MNTEMNIAMNDIKTDVSGSLLLSEFKKALDRLYPHKVYLHRDYIDAMYDEFTSTMSSEDAYSDPSQLEMFDENRHVKGI